MKTVLEQGGIAPGGLNFDAKVRRESTALEDMFIAHILGMVSNVFILLMCLLIYLFIYLFIYLRIIIFLCSFIYLFVYLFLSFFQAGRLRQGPARGRGAVGGRNLAWDGVGAVCELQGRVWEEAGGGQGDVGGVRGLCDGAWRAHAGVGKSGEVSEHL
jgi:hypothetical protein